MITLPRSLLLGPAFAGIAFLSAANTSRAQTPAFTPLQSSGIYAIGEKAGWTVALPAGTTPPAAGYAYTFRKNNAVTIATGTVDLDGGPASLDTTLDEPAMLYVSVTLPNGTKSVLGAAIAPTALQPSVPRPADFDAFWQAKLDALAAVPVNAVLTPADSGRAGVDYATLRLDNIGGAHVYGQVARPSRDGKFPAMLILQWAGVYGLQKAWVTDRAAEGWLVLNVEPHDLPGDQPDAYYANQPVSIKNYHTIGNDDRDQSYFLQMYLGDCRALDYLASRSDWDGKVLLVTGGSMGGQQSLAVAGLRPATATHVIVVEPAGCDTNGSLHGRTAGYPYWDASKPQVMETSRYFDPVNFASRIRATCLVAMGFVDTVAPPVGIWIAYNQIPSLKEAVPLIAAPHNDTATYAQLKPYYDRSYAWTSAVLAGTYPKINAAPVAPTVTWDPPIPAPAGTRLSDAHLNARASVPGTFTYAPAAGAVLAADPQTLAATFTPFDPVNFSTVVTQASLEVTPAAPSFTAAPQSAAVADGAAVTLSAAASPSPGNSAVTWQWQRNGTALAGSTAATLALPTVRPADTGLYTATATSGAASVSPAAIVGLTVTTKTVGSATEVGSDIFVASNGNTFDQVLLEGPAAAITADYASNQITRLSFVDLDDDIVQVEFSGPGTLSLVLESPSAPALPANYHQSVTYVKGHAGIVITGANEHSNVSVFTVGRATAVNQALFRDDVVYDGIADLAFIAISSPTGRFGGVRTANANYFSAKGLTGIYAPGVAFDGPVYIGNITTFANASPVILLGSARDVRITGGDLWQDKSPVRISGFTRLLFTAGSDSHGRALPARANRGTLDLNGENVTSRVVVGP